MSRKRRPHTRPRLAHPTLTTKAHSIPGPAARATAPSRLVDTELVLDGLCEQFHRRHDALLDATISRHSFALQAVHADPALPGYVHTIGLHTYDHHPELVVVGLRVQAAVALLDTLGDQVRAGARLATRHQCADYPGWPRLALLDVDPGNCAELLPIANRRYQPPDGPPIDALQVIWCDPTGHLPWEPGWALPHANQPILHYPHDDFADPDHEDDDLYDPFDHLLRDLTGLDDTAKKDDEDDNPGDTTRRRAS